MYVLRNLKKYTWYEIRVQPFYLTVEGQESNTVRVRTLEDGTYQTQLPLADPKGGTKDCASSVQFFFSFSCGFPPKSLLQTEGLVPPYGKFWIRHWLFPRTGDTVFLGGEQGTGAFNPLYRRFYKDPSVIALRE